MRSALDNVPGVYKVDVDYGTKTATVSVDKDAAPTTETMQAALEKAGFGCSVHP